MTAKRQPRVWIVTIDGRPDSAWDSAQAAQHYCDSWRVAWGRATEKIGPAISATPNYQWYEMEVRQGKAGE